jgi:hypothetical protein
MKLVVVDINWVLSKTNLMTCIAQRHCAFQAAGRNRVCGVHECRFRRLYRAGWAVRVLYQVGRPSTRYFGRATFVADPGNHRVVGTVAGGPHRLRSPNRAGGNRHLELRQPKGGSLGPWYNVEFDTLAPPYIQHNSSAKDGAGDFSLLLKYRLAAGNAENGDYSVSFSWAGTLPAGSYKHGNLAANRFPHSVCGQRLRTLRCAVDAGSCTACWR